MGGGLREAKVSLGGSAGEWAVAAIWGAEGGMGWWKGPSGWVAAKGVGADVWRGKSGLRGPWGAVATEWFGKREWRSWQTTA